MSKSKSHESIIPGHYAGVKVTGSRKEDLEYAIKLLKRKMKYSGVMDELKERRQYLKPSVVKREQKKRAIYAQQRRDEEIDALDTI